MTNIAFIGRAASGKSTATKMLVEAHGYTRVGFADPIRALQPIHNANTNDWRDLIRAWVYEYRVPDVLTADEVSALEAGILSAFERFPRVEGKNRALLQNIGTEVGRGIDDVLWIRLALNRAELIGDRAVLDDCRFENEARALLASGWVLCYMWASGHTLDRRYAAAYGAPMTDEQKAHPSESGIPALRELCQYVIHNEDDDLVALFSEVEFLNDTAHLIGAPVGV